jgi:hypothetical protein
LLKPLLLADGVHARATYAITLANLAGVAAVVFAVNRSVTRGAAGRRYVDILGAEPGPQIVCDQQAESVGVVGLEAQRNAQGVTDFALKQQGSIFVFGTWVS